MKKVILLSLLSSFFLQCNSQKQEQIAKPIEELTTITNTDSKSLIGTWYLTGTYVLTNTGRKKETDTKCQLQSYWKFYQEHEQLKQSRVTANGKDCSELISTTAGNFTLKNGDFIYFIDDVMYTASLKMISPETMTITTREFYLGKDTLFEKTYKKR